MTAVAVEIEARRIDGVPAPQDRTAIEFIADLDVVIESLKPCSCSSSDDNPY